MCIGHVLDKQTILRAGADEGILGQIVQVNQSRANGERPAIPTQQT